jgi:hypothetical protein
MDGYPYPLEDLIDKLPNKTLFECAKDFVENPSSGSINTQLALASELRRRRFFISEDAVLHAAASQIRGHF